MMDDGWRSGAVGDAANSVDDPINLVRRRVACQANPDEPADAEPLRHGRCVEISTGYEATPADERPGDDIRRVPGQRERNGPGARGSRRRTEPLHSVDLAKSIPESAEQRDLSIVACGKRQAEPGAQPAVRARE